MGLAAEAVGSGAGALLPEAAGGFGVIEEGADAFAAVADDVAAEVDETRAAARVAHGDLEVEAAGCEPEGFEGFSHQVQL
jgi:hypothetical protein